MLCRRWGCCGGGSGPILMGRSAAPSSSCAPHPRSARRSCSAAARQMERWQARYGAALNTGSKTGIRNAAAHGRPLSASERQRRGCQRARSAAASRRGAGSKSNSTPPFGASATPQKDLSPDINVSEIREACQRTSVTRASAPATSNLNAALGGVESKAARRRYPSMDEGGSAAVEGAVGSCAAAERRRVGSGGVGRRVRAREAQRRPVFAAIAGKDGRAGAGGRGLGA